MITIETPKVNLDQRQWKASKSEGWGNIFSIFWYFCNHSDTKNALSRKFYMLWKPFHVTSYITNLNDFSSVETKLLNYMLLILLSLAMWKKKTPNLFYDNFSGSYTVALESKYTPSQWAIGFHVKCDSRYRL